jgi:hypothetical protein
MKHKQEIACLSISAGCLVGVLLLLFAVIFTYRLIFKGDTIPSTPHSPSYATSATDALVDQTFAGQYMSATEKTKYELNTKEKRFSFYTTIGARLLLQTEIAPYDVHLTDDASLVIEISGDDRQAGGAPMANFRITKLPNSYFKLERMKPVGGNLGEFLKQP